MNEMSAYVDVADFMAQSIGLDELVRFRPSSKAQARLEELLHKDKEQSLTDVESAELSHYMHVEHMMRLAKAKARAKLALQ